MHHVSLKIFKFTTLPSDSVSQHSINQLVVGSCFFTVSFFLKKKWVLTFLAPEAPTMLKSIDNISTECFCDEEFDSEDFRALLHDG